MNGLKVFLENYDPAKINNDLLYILQMYSKDTNKISNFFRKLWVKKVSYPLLRRKIDKINTYAVNLIVFYTASYCHRQNCYQGCIAIVHFLLKKETH
jgi:hypothetical protein